MVGWDGGDWGWDGPGMGIMGVGVTWDGITGLGEGWDRGTGMGMGWDRDNWDGNDEIEMIGMEVIGMGGGWDRGTGGVKMGVNRMRRLGGCGCCGDVGAGVWGEGAGHMGRWAPVMGVEEGDWEMWS